MTDKISMIELFSGVGAQERALRQLGIPYEVKHTCDCDANAVLSYAAMRWDLEKEMETFEFPSQDKMIEELQAKNLGYDFQKGKHSITSRTPINKLKQYYIADKLSSNLGDISKVDKLPYADVVTYSFPCTDLSVAGKGEGMVNKCDACGHSWPIDFSNAEEALVCPNCGATVSSSTRSGLLGQVQRLLGVAKERETLPKYLLLENVKNLVGKKFKPQFDAWVKWLDSIGYNTYYKVLNAKHFGVCQNRERVFAISIRKDIDINGFTFPEPIPLTTRLKDVLEYNVDEKYYLPDDRIKVVGNYMPSNHDASRVVDANGIAPTVKENHGTVTAIAEPFVVASRGRNPENPSDRTIGAPTEQRLEPNFSGTTNCLTSVAKDNYVCEPKIIQNPHGFNKGSVREESPAITSSSFQENNYVAEPIVYDDYNSRISADQDTINTLTCNCGKPTERNGVKIIEPIIRKNEKVAIVEDQFPGSRDARIYTKYSPTLRQNCGGLQVAKGEEEPKIKWRIRKLTPLECWRLMNFTDEDCNRAAQYVSPSAQYKQAGNSIVVACLIAIFSSLFIEDGHKAEVWTKYQLHYWD